MQWTGSIAIPRKWHANFFNPKGSIRPRGQRDSSDSCRVLKCASSAAQYWCSASSSACSFLTKSSRRRISLRNFCISHEDCTGGRLTAVSVLGCVLVEETKEGTDGA